MRAHHMMAAQKHEVSFLSLSFFLSHTPKCQYIFMVTTFCTIIYQSTGNTSGTWGEDEDVIIYVLFNNTTQKSLFVRFLRLL